MRGPAFSTVVADAVIGLSVFLLALVITYAGWGAFVHRGTTALALGCTAVGSLAAFYTRSGLARAAIAGAAAGALLGSGALAHLLALIR